MMDRARLVVQHTHLSCPTRNEIQEDAKWKCNDGDGTFDTISRTFGTGSDDTHALAMGDVDGNGTLDLAVGNSGSAGGQNVVYFNQLVIFLPLIAKNY